MPFQSTVAKNQAFGVPGEIILDGPTRAAPYTIDAAATAANCVVGRFFTLDATHDAVPGGDLTSADVAIAGILSSPKQYATSGPAAGALAPTLQLAPGSVGEFLSMGQVCISVPEAATPDDLLSYTIATGVIHVVAKGGSPAVGDALIPNAKVVRSVAGVGGGLIIAQLTN